MKFIKCDFSLLPVLVILKEGEADGGLLGNCFKRNAKNNNQNYNFMILFLYVLVIHSQVIAFKTKSQT